MPAAAWHHGAAGHGLPAVAVARGGGTAFLCLATCFARSGEGFVSRGEAGGDGGVTFGAGSSDGDDEGSERRRRRRRGRLLVLLRRPGRRGRGRPRPRPRRGPTASSNSDSSATTSATAAGASASSSPCSAASARRKRARSGAGHVSSKASSSVPSAFGTHSPDAASKTVASTLNTSSTLHPCAPSSASSSACGCDGALLSTVESNSSSRSL